MPPNEYEAQVALLVRVLPLVATQQVFALKGGSAINLFHRDLPRLSVDLDLTYLPIRERAASLREIDDGLDAIRALCNRTLGIAARRGPPGSEGIGQLFIRQANAEIKIDVSPVLRGVVHPPLVRSVSSVVEERFGSAEMRIVAFDDLFGGKLHAALDRQHPRDLFDVMLLYENEGMTDRLFRTLLVYIASSPRPIHELLAPNLIDIEGPYAHEFEGMTRRPVGLKDLMTTRRRMIADLRSRLDAAACSFLVSLHSGDPDFEIIGLPHAIELPAVRWKVRNLRKLRAEQPAKHRGLLEELERTLEAA